MSPRVLIVSNTPFHLSDSNGRVLGTLLQDVNNEDKMQFCVNGSSVSSVLIEKCYRISDKTVLKELLSRKITATKLPCDIPTRTGAQEVRGINRTAFTMLARDLLWKFCMRRTEFFELAEQFKPDIVLWQYGDSGFMVDLARLVAERCNAKIAVFTTEDYYFKTWDYLSKKDKNLSYTLFSNEMKRANKRIFERASLCIANTPQLAERFKSAFGCRTETIMNSSELNQLQKNRKTQVENRIVYAGNLGINRHLSILKIAGALEKVDPSMCFEVYGRPSKSIEAVLREAQNIKLMGFRSYQEITEIIKASRLVIHTESFEEFYQYDLQAAFSTKITDALASGTPLFMFAPANLAETSYLIAHQCAFVCTEPEKLTEILRTALYDEAERAKVIVAGRETVMKNHNAEKNQKKMLKLLESVAFSSLKGEINE